jgi:hypothetical protein
MNYLLILIIVSLAFICFYKNKKTQKELLNDNDEDNIFTENDSEIFNDNHYLDEISKPEPTDFKSKELAYDFEPYEHLNPKYYNFHSKTSFKDVDKHQKEVFGFNDNIQHDKYQYLPDAVDNYEKLDKTNVEGLNVGDVFDNIITGLQPSATH